MTAYYHLPGLFEFFELYSVFLPLYGAHREYFYEWCEIASVYGAPADCLWGGGRLGDGEHDPRAVLSLMREYNISARLTFSNSLLEEKHLSDPKCNTLCKLFAESESPQNGVIVHSDLLLGYLKKTYPGLYFVSSTTKVLTDFEDFKQELEREDFRFVVPDFRLNKQVEKLNALPQALKDKAEFLCNECCSFGCKDRKACYEAVSRKNLGIDGPEHICTAILDDPFAYAFYVKDSTWRIDGPIGRDCDAFFGYGSAGRVDDTVRAVQRPFSTAYFTRTVSRRHGVDPFFRLCGWFIFCNGHRRRQNGRGFV